LDFGGFLRGRVWCVESWGGFQGLRRRILWRRCYWVLRPGGSVFEISAEGGGGVCRILVRVGGDEIVLGGEGIEDGVGDCFGDFCMDD
jgi:hypothetical protein